MRDVTARGFPSRYLRINDVSRFNCFNNIRFHFIRDYVRRKLIAIKWVATANNAADVFTKALGKIKFAIFRTALGMRKAVVTEDK